METLIFISVIIVVVLVFVSRGSNQSVVKKPRALSNEERVFKTNSDWLEERWETAKKEHDIGEIISVPYWFFDNVTDRQIQRIKDIGLDLKSELLTKGQASDIIGLFEPMEEEHEEILRFFKIPLKEMNQSRARHESAKLLSVKENFDSWNKRPASPMQKEFYKFFDLKVPQGLTHLEASNFISEYSSKTLEEDEVKLDEWENYESIYDEINDPDMREDYEIKKVSISLYRNAINELKKEGYNLSDVNDDTEIVVQKIIKLKPEIQKNY